MELEEVFTGPLMETIKRMAMRFRYRQDFEDLKQEAYLAVLRAVPRYQESRGATFKTYVDRRIQGVMQDYLRRESCRGIGSGRHHRVTFEQLKPESRIALRFKV